MSHTLLKFSAAIAAACALLAGCGSGGSEESAVLETKPLLSDVALYGKDPERQQVKLFVKDSTRQPKGVVVWIHGGGWFTGTHHEAEVYLEKLIDDGYAVVGAHYRLVPQGVYPHAVDDVKKVFSSMEAGGCDECTNPELWKRVSQWSRTTGWSVGGTSAGGHLSVLGAAEYLTERPDTTLRCVQNIVGPTNLVDLADYPPESQEMVYNFAGQSLAPLPRMSPLHRLRAGTFSNLDKAHWYSIYTTNDHLVPYKTVGAFEKELEAANIPVTMLTVEGGQTGGHGLTIPQVMEHAEWPVRRCFEGT